MKAVAVVRVVAVKTTMLNISRLITSTVDTAVDESTTVDTAEGEPSTVDTAEVIRRLTY